ncbi:hypothetical protein CEXT_15471 [Caerostris extrusa]|uniref:Uncharacterized protein n=1 Tax=Caerostris extrusa TaxID=172846 RepID=A0AAV4W8T4_CAEEX|nr:hypothetical protein CEXT_15471 [Caerostris extrusa]
MSLEANVTNIRRFFSRRLLHAEERSPEWKIAIPPRGNLRPASLEANVTNIRRFFSRRLSHAEERSPEWKIAIPPRGMMGASEEAPISTVCLQGPCLCTPLGRASLTMHRNNKPGRPLLVGGGRFLSAI